MPPPKSYINTVCSFSFSLRPYANAAAVGSLMMAITSNPALLPAFRVSVLSICVKYAGTVITAESIVSPHCCSASSFSLLNKIAEKSVALYFFPNSSTLKSLLPILLLKKAIAFVSPTDCIFFASSPKRMFPFSSKHSTEGVVVEPKLFFIICGFPVFWSILATAQKVVPKSIPTLIPMITS